jgi:hypothetical protein
MDAIRPVRGPVCASFPYDFFVMGARPNRQSMAGGRHWNDGRLGQSPAAAARARVRFHGFEKTQRALKRQTTSSKTLLKKYCYENATRILPINFQASARGRSRRGVIQGERSRRTASLFARGDRNT